MLVEPPRPVLPARAGLTISARRLGRVAASVAALLLAVLSRGDAFMLAALLTLAAWHLPTLAAVLPALLASSWRWGSTSLEAWAGAQAVLGPAGVVGPGRAAAASWLAAGALLLASPHRLGRSSTGVGGMGGPLGVPGAPKLRTALTAIGVGGMGGPVRPSNAPNLALAAATGATAAAVVAGPAVGGEIWVRAVATIVATVAALVVATQRARHHIDGAVDVAAVVAGVGAAALVAGDAPGWWGTVDAGALRSGALVALAVAALVAVGGRTLAALGGRAS